jgi:hypothetical protein
MPSLGDVLKNHDAMLAAMQRKQNRDSEALDEIQGFMKSMQNVPKWIEDLPGKRSPYFAVIDINLTANSTARVEGTTTISVDGPFVCTGLALYWKKTSGAYAGPWGPATAFGARISAASQDQGYQFIFDQPHCSSFTVEVTDQASDRLWQSRAVASALYAPEAGGAYILPSTHLFERNSTIKLTVTPDVAMAYTGTLQGIFLGYKIVQGPVYQP